jgi:hypothetical protein
VRRDAQALQEAQALRCKGLGIYAAWFCRFRRDSWTSSRHRRSLLDHSCPSRDALSTLALRSSAASTTSSSCRNKMARGVESLFSAVSVISASWLFFLAANIVHRKELRI